MLPTKRQMGDFTVLLFRGDISELNGARKGNHDMEMLCIKFGIDRILSSDGPPTTAHVILSYIYNFV